MNDEKRQPDPKIDYLKRFHEIYEVHNPRLYGIVRKHVSPVDVKDVLQEVWFQAFCGLKRLREKKKFRSWLVSIAYNRIKNHYRKNGRHPEWMDELDSLNFEPQDDPWPDGLREMDLDQAMQGLSEEHREAVILHIFRDWSLKEIARKRNLSLGTVKSRLHYAKARLREKLKDYSGK